MTTPTPVPPSSSKLDSTLINTPPLPSNSTHPYRKGNHPFSQPRFKLHTPTNNPSPAQSNFTLRVPTPHPYPQLCLEQSLPPTTNSHPSSLLPISHIASASTIVAAASSTLLSTWRLHPTYPLSPPTPLPFCYLQSQWQGPPDYSITSLAIAPDASVLALSLQHSDPPRSQNTVAILLLDPFTCTRLIRLSLPSSTAFIPPSLTPPPTNLSLAFFSSSHTPIPSSHLPLHSRGSDLPPHLRYAFHQSQRDDTSQAHFTPAFGPTVHSAKFALAVAGSNGVAAVYRFTEGYTRLFKYNAIDAVDLFNSDARIRMSTVIQISPAGSGAAVANPHLLGLCADKGVALFQDGVPAMKVIAEAFRPIAICACHRNAKNEMSAVLLVSRDSGPSMTTAKRSAGKGIRESEARLAFAVKSAHGTSTFVPVHNVREADLADLRVLEEDRNAILVVIQCTTKVLQYRITVRKDGLFLVTPSEAVGGFVQGQESSNLTNGVLVRRRDYVIKVNAKGGEVLVSAFGCRGDATGS